MFQVADNRGNFVEAEDPAAAATAARTLLEDDEEVTTVMIMKRMNQGELTVALHQITEEVNQFLTRKSPEEPNQKDPSRTPQTTT